MQNNTIIIVNNGVLISGTNYFETELAQAGIFFFSWNASALRILVPDNQLEELLEMATGQECIITRGRYYGNDCFELMFDDDSDDPYVIFTGMEAVNGRVEENRSFEVTAWSSKGIEAEWIGRYRKVEHLPCLEPWRASQST